MVKGRQCICCGTKGTEETTIMCLLGTQKTQVALTMLHVVINTCFLTKFVNARVENLDV